MNLIETPPHAATVHTVLAGLESSMDGLAQSIADQRLEAQGPNRFEPPPPVSAWTILRAQLRGLVVLLLIAAAIVAVAAGEIVEGVSIGFVLVINTAIGFLTEYRARRAMAALLELDAPWARVIRDGVLRLVPADRLVPGDLVEVTPGQHVPADARVIDSTDLRLDEAALTGESMPTAKTNAPLPVPTLLADRRNMIFKGTTVTAGIGRAVITSTGVHTELGRVAALVEAIAEAPTPLERRLDALGRNLVWFALGAGGFVAALGASQGEPLAAMIETGIALAVAAVPEALPAVATIALAVGVHRMAHRHALVRRLPAVESLGATTVVCTDKTRTLTSGDMAIVRVWAGDADIAMATAHSSPALRHVLEAGVLASRPQPRATADHATGHDPVDAAMLGAGERFGIDRGRLIAARPAAGFVPFSSHRKWTASFHHVDGSLVAFAKGAPRQILGMCARNAAGEPIDAHEHRRLMDVNERFARDGLRVVALASGPVGHAGEQSLTHLRFAGFVGLMDPPAAGVRQTIERLRRAGLRTIMLTGDQRLTAEAVGRELGVLTDREIVVDGRDLEGVDAEALARLVADAGAFSRISPEQKLAIVSALQDRGEIVAMLGDGINDAAALKKADVGVAMGRRGTDAAKQVASVVLLDDRFETIAAAVEEGRVIFDNIRKFAFYLFSCNAAEVLVLVVAGLAGMPLPVLPMQLLWLNIVTDTFPALALAMEPGDADIMDRPPRLPQEAILSRTFVQGIAAYAGLITVSTLGAYAWALGADPSKATTVAFMTLALAQTFHLGNARSHAHVLSPMRMVANRFALAAVGLCLVLQWAAISIEPLPTVLHVSPLQRGEWLVVFAAALVPAVSGQVFRLMTAAFKGRG